MKKRGTMKANVAPKRSKPKKGPVRKRRGPQVDQAPVAISDMIQQSVNFRGSSTGSLECSFTLPIMNVNQHLIAPSGTAQSYGTLVSANINLADRVTFNPVYQVYTAVETGNSQPSFLSTHAGYINPAWALFASSFTRYRVKRLVFHYMPQSPATQPGQMVFAWAADPAHPIIGTGVDEVLTNVSLLSVGDSVAFMPWESWSLDVTHSLSKDFEHYISEFGNPISNSLRFSMAGVFALTCSALVSSSPAAYGILYATCDLVLREFCPGLPTSIAVLSDHMAQRPVAIKTKNQTKIQKTKSPSVQGPRSVTVDEARAALRVCGLSERGVDSLFSLICSNTIGDSDGSDPDDDDVCSSSKVPSNNGVAKASS